MDLAESIQWIILPYGLERRSSSVAVYIFRCPLNIADEHIPTRAHDISDSKPEAELGGSKYLPPSCFRLCIADGTVVIPFYFLECRLNIPITTDPMVIHMAVKV